jgi:hypothetical protein
MEECLSRSRIVVTYSLIAQRFVMSGEVLRVGRKLTFGTDRSWREAAVHGMSGYEMTAFWRKSGR